MQKTGTVKYLKEQLHSLVADYTLFFASSVTWHLLSINSLTLVLFPYSIRFGR
jgi:hypothetical protein